MAGIEEGRLFRSIRKGGKVGESLSEWAVWFVVTEAAREIGIVVYATDCLCDNALTAPQAAALLQRVSAGESKTKLAKELGVSRNTIYMDVGRGGN